MPIPIRPEDRIRMLMGIDDIPLPQAEPAPMLPPPPQVPIPPMYRGDMVYVGDGDPMAPGLQPGDWEDGVSFQPPSRRDQVAAALQKRKAMGY